MKRYFCFLIDVVIVFPVQFFIASRNMTFTNLDIIESYLLFCSMHVCHQNEVYANFFYNICTEVVDTTITSTTSLNY